MPPLPRDAILLMAAAFARAVAVGMIGVLLGVYPARLGLRSTQIGYVIALGLAGMAGSTMIATFRGDRLGRRRSLALFAALGAIGGAGAAASSAFVPLAAFAFVGMLNGMGRDRGAALVLEQAALPGLTGETARTKVFAWYNVLQDGGGAIGSLMAGLPVLLRRAGLDDLSSLRTCVGLFSVLSLLSLVLYAGLSARVEAGEGAARARLSPASRPVVGKLCALSAMDSFGGGFLTTALLSYWFFQRFGVGEGVLGLLFFTSRLANAASHLGAAWLAGRIGLVNTMVFTHIPSSVLLLTVPFAPTFAIAVVLFVVREGLVEMDVPTRQSYTMAVVRPEERTMASGLTTMSRVAAWAAAPSFAGLMMATMSASMPLCVGSGIKICYDLLLWREFRHLRPPEER